MLVLQTIDKKNEEKEIDSEQQEYEECSHKRHRTHSFFAYELRMEFYIHILLLQSLAITGESMYLGGKNLYTLR